MSAPWVPQGRVPLAAPRFSARAEGRVLEVLRSGRCVGGPELATVEGALARAFGAPAAVGVASGTDALILMLRAAGVGPGWRVAVPAVSFFATLEAVLWVGAEPVVVDVCEDLPHLDSAKLPPVDAVLLVHLFGLRAQSPEHPVVLHDAAQALPGEPLPGPAALSFYPTKLLGCAGDGGAVLGEGDLVEGVRALGSHGLVGPHLHATLGRNSRLDALQAALVQVRLEELEGRLRRRAAIAEAYDAFLPRVPGSLHPYVALHPERDRLRAALDAAGIDSAVYYPRPMDAQPLLGGSSGCPVAERFCARSLTLPCHDGLDDAQVERVLRVLERHA